MGSQLQQLGLKSSAGGLREMWPRTSVHLKMNLLPAFESGEYYDCTIRVGCDLQNLDSSFKDFQCHRVILRGSSPVFETMFFSHFKEAKLGPDEPIYVDKIDLQVFESAMKFVYGDEKDFKTTAFGIKLYKFAQEMQINSLTDELVKFFKQTKASEIFALFDFYYTTGNQEGLDSCKSILENDTKEALDSSDWLNISSGSIVEFLKMECLNSKEADLVKALMKWGEFQLHQDGNDLVENLRSKVLPGLRQIKFDSLTQQEVAQLNKEELREVLTKDEKYSVLMSIITDDWKMMLTDVFSSSKLTPRYRPYTFCSLFFDESSHKINKIIHGTFSFNFEINKNAAISGIKLNMRPFFCANLMSITLFKHAGKTVTGTGDTEETALRGEEMFYKINAMENLVADTQYRITFTFDKIVSNKKIRAYTLQKVKNPSLSDGLALKLLNAGKKFLVHIQGIVFEKQKTF